MKSKKLKEILNNLLKYKQLYIPFALSLISLSVTVVCLASFTFAWFSTSETTKTNNIDAGTIAIELYKSNVDYNEYIEINEENPLFTTDDPIELGGELFKELIVSNHGTFDAEYNIGFEVESVNTDGSEGSGDISELIDVFIAKSNKNEESIYENSDYIYLGTLSYLNENKNYEDDMRVYVKGILKPQYDVDGNENDIDDYEDCYSLRFKVKEKAEAKYQNCNIKINMELVSNKIVDDLCTITALSNNEDFGLVLGGGTYYIDDGHTIELFPLPKPGYKFQKWEDDDSTNDPRIITTNGDQTYTAIFVKASEFEEEIDDPFGDDTDDPEEYGEHTDDPFED